MAQDITFILKARNDARRAVKSLGSDMDAVGKNVKRLEKDTEEASKATEGLGDSAQDAAAQTEELAKQTEEVQKKATLAARAFGLLTKAAAALGSVIASIGAAGLATILPAFLPARIQSIVAGIGALILVLGALSIFNGAAQSARAFNAALAETSTLIEGTPRQLDQLTVASRELVREFGGSKADQIGAFYQAISAGAATIPAATEIVREANKLAIGGVTDVGTAVDILTTAVNAYGPEVITAAEASDSLFIAMQQGKTTVGELASELGNVIPLAVTTGVSFDELTAATSALTTQGISTNVAVTQLRGILQSVIKPTSEARKAAKDLGVEFNVAALRTQGLQGFLQGLSDGAEGNVEVLAQLFGSVEALGGVLALTGGGSEKFAATLELLREKAGTADVAFEKVAQNLDARLGRATDSIAETFERFGNVVLRILVPAMEVLARVLELVADNFDVVVIAAIALSARALPALVLAVRGLLVSVGLLSAGTTRAGQAMSFLKAAATGNIAALRALATGAATTSRAMALLTTALSTIPFIAVIALATGIVRAFEDSRVAAGRLEQAVSNVSDAFGQFEAALKIFQSNASRASGEFLLQATRATIETVRAELKEAQDVLAGEEFKTNFFGRTAFETEGLRNARRVVEELSISLAELEATASAAEARIVAFDVANGQTAKAIRELVQTEQEVGKATFNAIPSVSELQAKYGEVTGTITEALRLTNELAIVNGRISFQNLLAETSAFLNQATLSSQKVADINETLLDIQTTDAMGDAAAKALTLAKNIIQAEGGIDELDEGTRLAVDKLVQAAIQAGNVDANARSAAGAIGTAANNAAVLAQNVTAAANALSALQGAINSLDFDTIGIEAQNRARGAGADAFATRRAGLLAQKEAELAPALGEGGFAAEIARQQLDEYTLSLDRNLNAAREAARQQEALTAATSTVGTTASGGGGSSAAAAIDEQTTARNALNDAIQQTIQGYRDEAELIGLYGEELKMATTIQNLQNVARQNGIQLTQQQIALVQQEAAALQAARGSADNFTNGLKAGLAAINEELPTTVEFTVGLMKQAFEGLSNAIVDLVTTGKADFKGLLVSLLTSISKFLADRLVANFMNGLFGGPPGGGGGGGGGLGGGGGGGFLGIIGKIFGKAASVGMADGGPVRGKGGPRSDSIPRWLSDGEFVVNARAAKDNMALLMAINGNQSVMSALAGGRAPAMAAGGMVAGGMASRASRAAGMQRQNDVVRQLQRRDTAPSANSFNPTLNFNFPGGDADSFRRSEAQIRARMMVAMQDADRRNN